MLHIHTCWHSHIHIKFFSRRGKEGLAMVAHTFNGSTWKEEEGQSLSSSPALSVEQVPGQPGLHRFKKEKEQMQPTCYYKYCYFQLPDPTLCAEQPMVQLTTARNSVTRNTLRIYFTITFVSYSHFLLKGTWVERPVLSAVFPTPRTQHDLRQTGKVQQKQLSQSPALSFKHL